MSTASTAVPAAATATDTDPQPPPAAPPPPLPTTRTRYGTLQSENGAWLPATTDYLVQVLEVLARLEGTDDTYNLDPARRFGQWEFKDMSPGSDLFELDLIM